MTVGSAVGAVVGTLVDSAVGWAVAAQSEVGRQVGTVEHCPQRYILRQRAFQRDEQPLLYVYAKSY